MKQTLLKDIELDIEQLKCLVNALDNNYNSILCEAAQRSIVQMKERLDTLLGELECKVLISPLLKDEVSISEEEEIESINELPEKEEVDFIYSSGNETENIDDVEEIKNDNAAENVQQEEIVAINKELVEDMKIALESVILAEENDLVYKEENEEILEEFLQKKDADLALTEEEFERYNDDDDDEEEYYDDNDGDDEEELGKAEIENKPLSVEERRVSYRIDQEAIVLSVIPVSDILRTDLRQFITLNDTFRFTRELFDGDSSKMKEAIDQLDKLTSFDEALTYMESLMTLDEEDEATQDFINILKKRFNR